jgi:serine racemase
MEANREKYAADILSIKEAHDRIKPYIHRTPVLTSESLNSISGRSLFFKCECLQKGGAFKFRGACNAVLSLDAEQAAKGVVTHSRFLFPYCERLMLYCLPISFLPYR